MKRYVLAITGASGSSIGLAVLRSLSATAYVHLLISRQAFSILEHEMGIKWFSDSEAEIEKRVRVDCQSDSISYHGEFEFFSSVSSGSFKTDGMVIVPCSMKTLGAIANGYSSSLIERVADVTIKEGRLLVLSPRESPFSAIHLENMLKLARLGVRIIPPVLGFYHLPNSVQDLVNFSAGKVLDGLKFEHELYKRWGG